MIQNFLLNKRGQIGEAENQKFSLTQIFPKGRGGQIGETMTWIVATLLIVVLLLISVYASVVLAKKMTLIPPLSENEFSIHDSFVKRSMMSYLLTKQNEDIVYKEIENRNTMDGFNYDLFIQIFYTIYQVVGESNYFVWMEVVSGSKGSGQFFDELTYGKKIISESVYLSDDKKIELNVRSKQDEKTKARATI
ncbi:MAG: hypothetical protein AABX28_01605 [Nanoarchaeota archaeon]